MKNTYSIAQRNQLVEAHLWCIDKVIQQNSHLMQKMRLDYDDVYQQLAIRLIMAVSGFDPAKGKLKQHIFAQLGYEFKHCIGTCHVHGITDAPRGIWRNIVSLDSLMETDELQLTAA